MLIAHCAKKSRPTFESLVIQEDIGPQQSMGMIGLSNGKDKRFYSFNLDNYASRERPVRRIDQLLDLPDQRRHFPPFDNLMGRLSIDQNT
ncbi:hypothetical protein BJG93_33655 (plasmid) [Paraburkholderia sprentiae WSM5005]|uniref:Uncharacterized protein n=1 Tax=Paraburkholderia sprentiae WSM5005 TaxID=754502 RepID=A0A1I9YWB6_9BURK|nr:hypothetical protein [Paraburkholderia sprentiae]APA90509.2 hypothetical protein BJG93_33655 [Paraburkholderia sprentiae WSM5005]